ncbi:transposase [Rickettsia endosymbiont of Urophora cardui]|uniref:transposase n=1 Tax=Rickettsia endosymbiont of Urophora cardui TaxID=3066265 RepID=UPI00313AEF21
MFEKYPNLKEKLWGSEFWSKGYFMSTVGKHGDEQKLRNYVQNQGSGKPSYKPEFWINLGLEVSIYKG